MRGELFWRAVNRWSGNRKKLALLQFKRDPNQLHTSLRARLQTYRSSLVQMPGEKFLVQPRGLGNAFPGKGRVRTRRNSSENHVSVIVGCCGLIARGILRSV